MIFVFAALGENCHASFEFSRAVDYEQPPENLAPLVSAMRMLLLPGRRAMIDQSATALETLRVAFMLVAYFFAPSSLKQVGQSSCRKPA